MVSCVPDAELGYRIPPGNDIDGPCLCGHKSVSKIGVKQGECSWGGVAAAHMQRHHLLLKSMLRPRRQAWGGHSLWPPGACRAPCPLTTECIPVSAV